MNSGEPLPKPHGALAPQGAAPLPHSVLTSLLGAWALAACSPAETAAVEEHLGECGACADEAVRLREAVGLLHPTEHLDLAPELRAGVLEGCLAGRPPRVPVPRWTAPYDAETARLDALLQDIAVSEWHAPVRLGWYADDAPTHRRTTVAGVIAHLLSVDGLVAVALGLDDPLGPLAPGGLGPTERTETFWSGSRLPPTSAVREPWREQSHRLIRAASFAAGPPPAPAPDDPPSGAYRSPAPGGSRAAMPVVPYGGLGLPLPDAMLERAFECWIHADDIAVAVDYPYQPPSPAHLHAMIALAARLLPGRLAERHRRGLTRLRYGSPRAGRPPRTLRLEIEGAGGGQWLLSLDPPALVDPAERGTEVAHIALDDVEFCRLAAGRLPLKEIAAGLDGDRAALCDVLYATASLSRL